MGYRGKPAEQDAARALRAQGWRLADIVRALGVSKSSVSLWVRSVPFQPSGRRTGARRRGPNALQQRKAAEIEACDARGREMIGTLSERDLLVAGAALYAGEGSKADGRVGFANTDPDMVRLFMSFLRHCFEIDPARLRVRVYLHEGLDLARAERHWSDVTGVPLSQFGASYRAVADPTRRQSKHPFGCAYITYGSSRTHRRVMGLIRALLSSDGTFRGGAIGSAVDC